MNRRDATEHSGFSLAHSHVRGNGEEKDRREQRRTVHDASRERGMTGETFARGNCSRCGHEWPPAPPESGGPSLPRPRPRHYPTPQCAGSAKGVEGRIDVKVQDVERMYLVREIVQQRQGPGLFAADGGDLCAVEPR